MLCRYIHDIAFRAHEPTQIDCQANRTISHMPMERLWNESEKWTVAVEKEHRIGKKQKPSINDENICSETGERAAGE